MKTYTPTIGIEVHAELKTKTKMFCNSRNDPHASEPNTHVCPVCMAHPGTLPVINKDAVGKVLMIGVALRSELATYTEFDRKNYFYPDIPKGYQISQYQYPLVKGGSLAGVNITRVHLEEDTARSSHDQNEGSVIDFNRAGVPLMELVTEPVIHDAQTAGNFARELQLLLRTLGVSDANMEKGEMRVEANISVSSDEGTLGTKVEVKNLNSFKSVESAIEFEIKRQIKQIEDGGTVTQETRGWDKNRGKTYSQRIKESADDYRYFPDPDLPSLDISNIEEFSLSRLTEQMPELPEIKRKKYEDLGLTKKQIETIISNFELATFFSSLLELNFSDSNLLKAASNYLTTDVLSLLEQGKSLDRSSVEGFASLMEMVSNNAITSRVAKDLLSKVLFDAVNPASFAEEQGLLQNSDQDSLNQVVEQVVNENLEVVADYKKGKRSSLQFLVGQGMKATRGSANPTVLAELLEKHLETIE